MAGAFDLRSQRFRAHADRDHLGLHCRRDRDPNIEHAIMETGLEFLQFQAVRETDQAFKLAVGQLRERAVALAPLFGLLALSLDVELIALNSDFEIFLGHAGNRLKWSSVQSVSAAGVK